MSLTLRSTSVPRCLFAGAAIVSSLALIGGCASSGDAAGASPSGTGSGGSGGEGGEGGEGAAAGAAGSAGSAGAAGNAGAAGAAGSAGAGGSSSGARDLVYVSTSGDDNASGMSPDDAVLTVATGIMRAQSCSPAPCTVAIEAGEFSGQVQLVGGIDLHGGYAPGFDSRDPSAHETVLTSDQPRTVIADSITTTTTLDGLTLRGANFSMETTGASTYGLWVNATTSLNLVQTTVEGGDAAPGMAGAEGEAVSCSATGGQGGEAFDCGGSQGGEGTAGGDPTSGGGGGPPGSSNCPNACPLVGSDGISGGTTGTDGDDGRDGAPGAIADDTLGSFDAGFWVAASGEAGARGFHGTGGGGGGSGGSKRFRACFGCGTLLGGRGGDGAPGGCGGGGGAPGQAGGGSFAIVLIDSTLDVDGVFVQGGKGGKGGSGGTGREGEAGGTSTGMGREDGGSQKCGLINYSSGGGGNGGLGGKGGWGGGGSGGVGGVSIGIAIVGTSSVVESGELTVSRGTAGPGGAGGLGGPANNDAQPGFEGAVWGQQTF